MINQRVHSLKEQNAETIWSLYQVTDLAIQCTVQYTFYIQENPENAHMLES